MQTLWQDVRYGVRMLLKNPGFTSIAVITLALGIGANTAIFSVVNAVLLKPLPIKEPGRLMMVWNKGAEAAGGDRTPLAVADLLDWRANNWAFEDIGAFQNISYSYTSGESPEQVMGVGVTANFFLLLGVQAAQGRTFLPDEERPGAPRTVVISDSFWRQHFASDPQAVGKAITLNGVSFTIVGIMPNSLQFPSRNVNLWTAMQTAQPTRRGPYFLRGVARLNPGVTPQQALVEMNSLKSSFSGEPFNFNVLPVTEYIVGDVRLALLALLAAVTLVLLIAAANVANLSLVRASSRAKEVSLRAALGASRRRIVRQLLTESLILAGAGGFLGVLLALWGVDLLVKLAPTDIPRLEQVTVDGSVFGWAALVSLATGILFGLIPAWQSSRLNLNEVLKESGRSLTESPGRQRWRNLLVVVELALSVVLIIGAGLMVKSLLRLQQVDAGVNSERVLTASVELPGARYREVQQVRSFYTNLLDRVKTLPGIQAVAVSNSLPPDSVDFSSDFAVEGQFTDSYQIPPIANFIRVSKDYFQALGLPLKRGRLFAPTDTLDSPDVVLISEGMARAFFSSTDPIGKRLNLGSEREPAWCEIVGVVGDVKYNGLATDTMPAIYQSATQSPSWGMFLIIKTEPIDPLGLTAAVRNEVWSLDKELPVTEVRTMEQRFAAAVEQPRFRTLLISLFAAVALILACIGIYGVISYSVSLRIHEIGVRMALGAQSSDVLWLIIGQGMGLALFGIVLGLGGAYGLTRLMENLLFRVSANDPSMFTLIPLLLLGVALLACYLPARRAATVDPMVALREE